LAHGRSIFSNRRVAARRRARLWRILRTVLLLLIGVPLLLILLYGVLPPPGTPLMVIRMIEGESVARQWVALEEMSPHLPRAVIAAEDNNFCQHDGFDWGAVQEAVTELRDGKRPRGASTISMQTAKNLFLWPGRDYLRKGLEVYLTLLLELGWSKRRILEVYLNVVEFSGGVYGAEAASRHYFGKPAKALTQREAALLATVLPNPRERSAAKPGSDQKRMASTLISRIKQIEPLLDCF
jgi:monofunctional biosynthetic peptidoglycan transglycosylase